MAQLGARLNGIEEVEGSNPSGSTEAEESAAPNLSFPNRSIVQWSGFIIYGRLNHPLCEG